MYLRNESDMFSIKAINHNPFGEAHAIDSIKVLDTATDYVYDLETESGHFQAGVGEMIVKNTDSCMLHFNKVRTLSECFELCEEMEKAINAIFPKPMYLELEKIYSKYFLLSKKRYVGYIVDKNGELITTDKKGVVIKRRDNCCYLRDIYTHLIDMVMAKEPRWKVYEYLQLMIDDLLSGNVELEKLIITKSIKDNYKNQNLPHVAVAKKMRERGKYVAAGTRVHYVFTETEGKNDPQYLKAEDPDHYLENQGKIRIDYLYYFEKQLVNPIDEVLEVKFGVTNVLKNLLRLLKKGIVQNASPRIQQITKDLQTVIDSAVEYITDSQIDNVLSKEGSKVSHKNDKLTGLLTQA
jgi:DNA polymerase elongation subunit (family B)